MNRSFIKRQVIVLFSVICLLSFMATGLSTVLASNMDQSAAGLFAEAEGPLSFDFPDDPVNIRRRFVHIDFNLLASIDEGDRLLLNLFDDNNFYAVFEDKVDNTEGGTNWVGHLEGIPYGGVVMVQAEGQIAGNISMPGAFFAIRHVGDGVHAINQIDQTKFLPEADPVVVEIPDQEIADAAMLPLVEDGSIIDIMVVYTPAARDEVGDEDDMNLLINLAILETNTSYSNSGISQQLNLVHSQVVSYTETVSMNTDLTRLSGISDGYLDDIHSLRNSHYADLVSLFRKKDGAEACGIAHLMDTVSIAYANKGFSVINQDCAAGYYSFGHELGHNMGATHDWYADDSKDFPYSYNKGYINLTDTWRTIMSYNDECDCSDEGETCPDHTSRTTPGTPYCTRLQYWSNPEVNYNDDPMGVAIGSSTLCVKGDLNHPDCDADNRSVLNNTAKTVANFRVRPQINIAITPFYFDHVGGLLEEFGYSWTQIADTDLNNYDTISHYDVIFANCNLTAPTNGPNAAGSLRQFVGNGGSLYASDFAYTYINSAFPDFITFFDPPHAGTVEMLTADIIDGGLSSYLDPTNPPSVIELNYTHDGWIPIESVSADTKVHFQVDIPISEEEILTVPLAASFIPYSNSTGRVVYTSFHNQPQISDLEKKLVKYLLLIPSTSEIVEAAEQEIDSKDVTHQQTNINTINQGASSPKFVYKLNEISRLAFVINWPGSILKLKVFKPDGSLFDQKVSDSPPLTIIVPEAQAGKWKYRVEGMDVPFDNYPYVVAVGDKNIYTNYLYLPTILDK